MQGKRWNRREWISTATAAATAAAVLPAKAFGSLGGFSSEAGPSAVADAALPKLRPFPLTDVRLRPGIFQQYMQSNYSFLDSLPNDQLLHMFRVTAGIPSS